MKKKFGNKRKVKEAVDVDITSLLDVLVILLVFLLKSYNASDLKLDLANNVTMPDSKSRIMGHHALIVQVSKDKNIFINNKKIGLLRYGGKKDAVLLSKLKAIKTDQMKELKETPKGKEHSRMKVRFNNVNLVLDQELTYAEVKKIMHTAAMAGYPQFKFIVKGNY